MIGCLFSDTSALEKQIDEMVYVLYGLMPEEIAVVEGRKSGGKGEAVAITDLP
ncbi:MAG: hypothetical protein AAB302_00150 [Deltaproteobacteria bacterium]